MVLVFLSMAALYPLQLADANLLPNPTLAEGWAFPRGWTAQGGAEGRVAWVASADGSVSGLRLTMASARDWIGVGTTARIECGAGESLTVAAWIRTAGPVAGRTRLFVRFFDSDGGFIGQDGPELPAGADRWTRVTGLVVAPRNAASCDVSLQVWDAGAVVELTGPQLVRGGYASAPVPAAPPEVPLDEVPLPRHLRPDADGDRIPDEAEQVLGTDPAVPDPTARATRRRTTSFQTPTAYMPENDIKTDVVIIAGNSEESIRTWAAMGYEPHVMAGFRAAQDYVEQYPGDAQVTPDGTMLTCGPGSYYMVPTERRRAIFEQYFFEAVARGARAACPEEPEFFIQATHSDSFRQLYERAYGTRWEPPGVSVDARYRACRLQADLQQMLLEACWDGARRADPNALCFLLAHSPVNYAAWGIVCPHWQTLSTGRVDGLVGQVWTGTARSPVRLRGAEAERTFENAYLEYASLVGLARGLPTELWFLMDPLEDNPNRTMEDYFDNYRRTLCAALFFPEVDCYEVMPWPTRIFGRVPDEFATVICSVVGVLADIQNHAESDISPKRPGIATFVADSLQWQRADPAPSTMDSFYGLCLPLLADGVPVEVAQLERASEAGYLEPYRTLLLCYDAMKPINPATHTGISEWVRSGGNLIVVGGNDEYNNLDEWWRRAGYSCPQDHLFAQLGLDVGSADFAAGGTGVWTEVARTEYRGRLLENQGEVVLDLTRFATEHPCVALRFEDTIKSDGWGPLVTRVVVEATWDGVPVRYDFAPATPGERTFMYIPGGATTAPGMRFADANESFAYAFPVDIGSPVTARVTIGNQYAISASGVSATRLRFEGDLLGDAVEAEPWLPVTTYRADGLPALRDSAGRALVFRAGIGAGTVTFCGLPARVFCASEQWDALLPRLLPEPTEPAGGMVARRGPYVSAKATESGRVELVGDFVDLLTADLRVLHDVAVAAGDCRLLRDWTEIRRQGLPRLLAASAHVELLREEAGATRLFLQGPLGTPGVARLYCGDRTARIAAVAGPSVGAQAFSLIQEEDTALIRYPCDPIGVAISVVYE